MMRITLGLAIIILSGCAATEKKSAATSANGAKPARSRAFTETVGADSPKQSAKVGSCAVQIKDAAAVDWKAHLRMARTCVEVQDWSSIESLATTMSQKNPESPWGFFYLSLVAGEKKEWARARWMIESAIAKSADRPIGLLYYQRGRLLSDSGSPSAAFENYKEAIKLDPTLSEAHRYLGLLYFRDHDYRMAQKHLVQLEAQGGLKAEIEFWALAKSHVELSEFEKAAATFESARRAHPQSSDLHVELAQVYETHLKKTELALRLYREIALGLEKGRLKGAVAVDLKSKITSLEKIVQAQSQKAASNSQPSTREPASIETGVKK